MTENEAPMRCVMAWFLHIGVPSVAALFVNDSHMLVLVRPGTGHGYIDVAGLTAELLR
jgi:hypothetical protein